MVYYIWEFYSENTHYAYCKNLTGLNEAQKNALKIGFKLVEEPLELKANVFSEDESFGDAIQTSVVSPILSEKIVKLLTVEKIQVFPVILDRSTSEPYHLVQIYDTRKNLNWEKSCYSTFEQYPDEIKEVGKLALKEFDKDPPLIYRLEEIPSCFVVERSLKIRIEAASKTAGAFIKISDYRL